MTDRALHGSFPVVISVDVDGDLPLRSTLEPGVVRPRASSAGRYGPEVGAYRLLKAITELGLSADWFVPGEVAASYTELLATLVAEGQPIATHGDLHRDFDTLSLDEQIQEMVNGKARLQQLTDREVTGLRLPAGDWKPGFIHEMAGVGFQWSSSLAGGEELLLLEDGVVEIPVRYELEDLQYFGFSMDPPFPPGQSRIALPDTVERNWRLEAAGASRYGTLFHLRLNAEVMGTPGRTRMLMRFLQWLSASTGADFISCQALVERERSALPEYNLYRRFLELRASEQQ